ncbi:MAG TPA: hypothetical protein VKA08_12760 [Balneolales bacterium]|nr:hypothetical protein [Balneolales bacterium]
MLKKIRHKIRNQIASRHVAGPQIDDALEVCRWAMRKGFSSILSPWKDADASARSMFESYKLSMTALHNENINGYLSIKLDAIDYDFGIFKDLVQIGRKLDIRVQIDSLDPHSAAITFRFLEKMAEYHDILGCTLPSRWQRSLTDADKVLDLGLSVRIVKGQWPDPTNNNLDCVKNYLAIVEKLADRARHVGVATHDLPLAKRALSDLRAAGTYCELEQFSSLPLNGMETARKLGCPYRVYVAYGQPGLPYNIRFALTRPAIVAWVITDFALNLKRPWL